MSRLGTIPGSWFTNIDHGHIRAEVPLRESYSKEKHPHYDGHDVIFVDKVKNIPYDYEGVMAVPVTFLAKLNHDQFEVVGWNHGAAKGYTLNGKQRYNRLHVRRLVDEPPENKLSSHSLKALLLEWKALSTFLMVGLL